SPRYTLDRVRKDPNRFIQLLRVSYPSPMPDDFSSYFVGNPAFAIRNSNGSLSHQELRRGTKLDFKPTSRFCCGNQHGGEGLPCSQRSSTNPFGSSVSSLRREERCDQCRTGNEYVDCLTR